MSRRTLRTVMMGCSPARIVRVHGLQERSVLVGLMKTSVLWIRVGMTRSSDARSSDGGSLVGQLINLHRAYSSPTLPWIRPTDVHS